MSMYCMQCGAKLREGAKFCHSCGKPVPAAKSSAKPEATEKSGVRDEIKQKAFDLTKAGVQKILAALKDNDIDAPAKAGEVTCKSDAAQNAFMKLLKKGILSIVLILGMACPLSAQKTEIKFQTEGPIGELTVKLTGVKDIKYVRDEKANNDHYTFHYYQGTLTSDKITVETIFVPSPGNASTVQYSTLLGFDDLFPSSNEDGYEMDPQRTRVSKMKRDRSAPGSSLTLSDKCTITPDTYGVRVYIAPAVDLLPDKYSPQEEQPEGLMVESFVLSFIYDGETVVEEIDTQASSEADDVSTGKYLNTEGIDGIVDIEDEDGNSSSSSSNSGNSCGSYDDPDEDSHPGNWKIPAAVVGGLAGLGIIRSRRRNKAAAKKEKSASSKKKNDTNDDRDDDDEEEDEATYEMRIRKDFGDTLAPGAAPKTVFAKIVRIPKGGRAETDPTLTDKIAFFGDSYLKVDGKKKSGEYMSASVQAPMTENIPQDAVVSFRLASGGVSFTNRMHFKVVKSEIKFFQENITLPACSDEEWRLPFVVLGFDKNATVEAVISGSGNKYDVKVEPAEKEGCFYAVITEKAKDKMEPGTWELFNLGVKAISGTSELVESIPLYRFHMGLRFDPYDTIPCYLKTSATGAVEPAKAMAELAYFDWDPETNDIVTLFPVPTEFNISAEGETEKGYLEKLGITCKATSVTTDNGRQLEIYPVKGVLDAPTRFNATITLTADCGQGRVETVTKEVLIASQPVRQNVTPAMLEEDRRIGEGLLTIQKSIWDHGEYSRLFPLYKLIDVMVDGYDGAYGYDKHQVETVKDVYKRFLSGDLAGANATAKQVTLADEMAMFIDAFLQTSEEVENSMGFFTRMAVGVATLGMSDAVFTALQVARDMKTTAEKGGDTWDVFVAGVKVVAWEAAMDADLWKDVAKRVAPTKYAAAAKKAEQMAAEAKNKAKEFFSGFTGKKTGSVLDNSRGVKSKAAKKADDAIEAFRKNPEMSDLEKKLDQVYKNGQANGKAKVDDLQAAQWLMENNPTPENVKLYKKKVLEVQRDKFAMHQLNNLPEGNSTRAAFNSELDNVYKDVDLEVRETLRKQGYDMADSPFAATSSNKADLKSGKKVTFDRDVTYQTKAGKDVPQKVAQEAYEKAFYKRTTGIDAPNSKVASEWALMHDQSVVQRGSRVSYSDDLNPVIKDWDVKLSDAERTGKVMTYKSTEWFEQSEQMIWKANTLENSALRLEMLEQALSKRQEAARQMVKQFRYVHERDVAAQTKGMLSKISERMRFGMEISSRLFSTGKDALTLSQVEAILAKNNMTLELLSAQLGNTLKAIG